jgi:hypothetical protein
VRHLTLRVSNNRNPIRIGDSDRPPRIGRRLDSNNPPIVPAQRRGNGDPRGSPLPADNGLKRALSFRGETTVAGAVVGPGRRSAAAHAPEHVARHAGPRRVSLLRSGATPRAPGRPECSQGRRGGVVPDGLDLMICSYFPLRSRCVVSISDPVERRCLMGKPAGRQKRFSRAIGRRPALSRAVRTRIIATKEPIRNPSFDPERCQPPESSSDVSFRRTPAVSFHGLTKRPTRLSPDSESPAPLLRLCFEDVAPSAARAAQAARSTNQAIMRDVPVA